MTYQKHEKKLHIKKDELFTLVNLLGCLTALVPPLASRQQGPCCMPHGHS